MKPRPNQRLSSQAMAFVLAGGRGSRLKELTDRRAKPAVYFGGKTRIIDFALSNALNSGIRKMAIATQYKAHSLIRHVQRGWGFFRAERNEYLDILPASQRMDEVNWYRGTADAVAQNIDIIDSYGVKYVIVLAGDHIYKMDYESMIATHEARGADLTVAAMEVPWEETSRFGVMTCDDEGWITGFVEKQQNAPSNLASMGIYVFDYKTLVAELEAVVGSRQGYDFGHDVIPHMLGRRKLLAYPFCGYWRDVGTIKSYLDANMDCLDPASGLDLRAWNVCTNPDQPGLGDRPPVRLGAHGRVEHSLVAAGCVIDGEVDHSVLFPGVVVAAGARVAHSIVLNDCRIGRHCLVTRSVLDKEVRLGDGSRVGEGDAGVANRRFPTHLDSGITVIGKQAVIPQGCRIGTNCLVFPAADLGALGLERVADGTTVDPAQPEGTVR